MAFRCGYWSAAGDPVAIDSQELAREVGVRKATFLRLLKVGAKAWEGVERDDSCRGYPDYCFGPHPEKSGTHTRNEGDADTLAEDWPDVLLDLPVPD